MLYFNIETSYVLTQFGYTPQFQAKQTNPKNFRPMKTHDSYESSKDIEYFQNTPHLIIVHKHDNGNFDPLKIKNNFPEINFVFDDYEKAWKFSNHYNLLVKCFNKIDETLKDDTKTHQIFERYLLACQKYELIPVKKSIFYENRELNLIEIKINQLERFIIHINNQKTQISFANVLLILNSQKDEPHPLLNSTIIW